jgi:cell division septation protein DedD
MDRQGCNKTVGTLPLSGLLLLLAILTLSNPSYAGSTDLNQKNHRPAGKHYYYPDHNFSPYNYQSTGDFANRPMVVPPSVPVFRQPAYYYMDGPQARRVVQPSPHQVVIQPVPSLPQQNRAGQTAMVPPQLPQQQPPQQQTHPANVRPPQQAMAPNPAPVQQGQAESYSLHVGSFLVYDKADGVDNKVKALGLNSFRREVAAEGIRYLQLHVGPFQSKDEMKQAAKLLDDNQIKNRIMVQ